MKHPFSFKFIYTTNHENDAPAKHAYDRIFRIAYQRILAIQDNKDRCYNKK